jgi:hypothetical protein
MFIWQSHLHRKCCTAANACFYVSSAAEGPIRDRDSLTASVMLSYTGAHQSAAVAIVSVLATLLAVALVWALVSFVRSRRQQR